MVAIIAFMVIVVPNTVDIYKYIGNFNLTDISILLFSSLTSIFLINSGIGFLSINTSDNDFYKYFFSFWAGCTILAKMFLFNNDTQGGNNGNQQQKFSFDGLKESSGFSYGFPMVSI